jgi:hypothetical protein
MKSSKLILTDLFWRGIPSAFDEDFRVFQGKTKLSPGPRLDISAMIEASTIGNGQEKKMKVARGYIRESHLDAGTSSHNLTFLNVLGALPYD